MRSGRPGLSRFAAALMALALLSYASVQSIVMQGSMVAPATTGVDASSGRGGMAMSDFAPTAMTAGAMQMDMPQMGVSTMGSPGAHEARRAGPRPAHGVATHRAACPFCSAAAHLPILTGGVPIRVSQVVAFAAFRLVASHGPRGPPAPQPRARGPPTDS